MDYFWVIIYKTVNDSSVLGVKKSDSPVIIDTTVDDNRIILDHYSDLNDSSLAVEYFKEFKEVIIVGGNNLINIPPENIPALIVMLQTVYKAS